jgi:hypothetical protein
MCMVYTGMAADGVGQGVGRALVWGHGVGGVP